MSAAPPPGAPLRELRKFLGYCLSGFAATGTHYVTMVLLVWRWEGHEIVASCVGFVVGALVKYPLNYWVNFASRQRHVVAVPRFVVGLALGFALNAIVLAVLLQALPRVHYMCRRRSPRAWCCS